MATTKEDVNFEPEATPNFPVNPRRWYAVWTGEELTEVPAAVHAFQVPFLNWESEKVLNGLAAKLVNDAQSSRPGRDVKIVFSRGSGKWAGQVGLHLEGPV